MHCTQEEERLLSAGKGKVNPDLFVSNVRPQTLSGRRLKAGDGGVGPSLVCGAFKHLRTVRDLV